MFGPGFETLLLHKSRKEYAFGKMKIRNSIALPKPDGIIFLSIGRKGARVLSGITVSFAEVRMIFPAVGTEINSGLTDDDKAD